ncbi:MAG TPA: succinate dehydrogenase, cytochrome b556 subunit [Ktedonobacterales bacterium]
MLCVPAFPVSAPGGIISRKALGARVSLLTESFPLEESHRMYRGQSGQWSWLLHRVTGLAILLFLLVHIVDITLIGFGPTIYNDAIGIFSLWPIRLVSLALIGAVLFHAFNGIRIILIDFWAAGYKYQSQMFYIVLVVTILCFLPMAYFVVAPIFGVCPQGSCSMTPM